jgi:hypothetical protein
MRKQSIPICRPHTTPQTPSTPQIPNHNTTTPRTKIQDKDQGRESINDIRHRQKLVCRSAPLPPRWSPPSPPHVSFFPTHAHDLFRAPRLVLQLHTQLLPANHRLVHAQPAWTPDLCLSHLSCSPRASRASRPSPANWSE